MENEIEIIDIPEEDLELIEKYQLEKYSFPAITITNNSIYFNIPCINYMNPEAIIWYITSEYVIALPSNRSDRKAYKTRRSSKETGGLTAARPDEFKAKKIKNGYYKLYKYKNGMAFKRYEPLEELEEYDNG